MCPSTNPAKPGWVQAWLLAHGERIAHRLFGERKRKLFEMLPRRVVEIGAGAGANLRYYQRGTELIAIEPNAHALDRLAARAAKLGVQVDARETVAESIDLPGASTDAVVATLVLCSVDRPVAVLQEVRRVLRPGGRLLLLEHVAAPRGTPARAVQDLTAKPWGLVFGGCRPNQETAQLIEEAGFESMELTAFRIGLGLPPAGRWIVGQAVR